MIEDIIKNIDFEMRMLKEISGYAGKMDSLSPEEKVLMKKTIDSIKESMGIINSSVRNMIKGISAVTPLKPVIAKTTSDFEEVSMNMGGSRVNLTLERGSKDRFLEDLRISEDAIKKIRDRRVSAEVVENYRAPRMYLKIANGLFLPIAKTLAGREFFQNVSKNLRKANMDYLLEGYISMTLLTTFIGFIVSIFLFVMLLFLDFHLSAPYITNFGGDLLMRIIQMFWIPIILPLGVFLFMCWYPSSEKDSLESKIDQELPFAVVNMSAISGSGVEPSIIFKIVATGTEYPYLKKEFIKLMNQINLQGYDLITALNNSSRNSPSKRLGELFSGIAVTISTGGELSDFFEKRAQSLVTEYRLTREKFTKLAETSMDLYITLVIAAPMILLLIFVLLGITDFGPSLSPQLMTFILIMIIGIMNVFFLAIMRIKQPNY